MRRSGVFVLVGAGLFAAGCARGGRSADDLCHEGARAPVFEAAAPFAARASSLVVEFDASVDALVRRVEREVPRELAREKDRPIGAPGKATYVVRRGAPKLTTKERRLELEVPISATIDVCKPLGSFCLGYGHCEPAFDVTFRLDTEPRGFELPPPEASLEVTKRCVIAVDVTDSIAEVARKELRAVERRVAHAWPKPEVALERAREALRRPLELDGACFFPTVDRIEFAPPRVAAGRFSLGARVTGRVEPTACDQTRARPELPAPSRAPARDEATLVDELVLPEIWRLEELARALDRFGGPVDEELEVVSVEPLTHRDELVLRVRVRGATCASFDLHARPRIDAENRELWLDRIEVDGGSTETRALLARHFGSRPLRSVAELDARRRAALERLTEALASPEVREFGLETPKLPAELEPIEVRVVREGLALEAALPGRLAFGL